MGELINVIVIGGLLGIIGQGARTAIGLKKLQDKVAATPGASFNAEFSPSQLLVSLFIGSVAGALSALMIDDFSGQLVTQRDHLIALIIASGYAGTDFIEGAIAKASGVSAPGSRTGTTPASRPEAANGTVATTGASASASTPATASALQASVLGSPPDAETLFAARFADDPSYAPLEWVREQPGATETWR